MNIQETFQKTMVPVDWLIEVSTQGIRRTPLAQPLRTAAWTLATRTAGRSLQSATILRVFGQENIPDGMGVILAPNHQSWLDSWLVTLACPREVSFVTRAHYARVPVLRFMLELGNAIYLQRGNDESLSAVADRIRSGACVGIFPEGTVPGEGSIPPWAVDRQTGLLPGRSGAVRLALMSGAPVIPVGISGSRGWLPPELFPRLQTTDGLKPEVITVRFGEPIRFQQRDKQEVDYDQLRGMTNKLMASISDLIDDRSMLNEGNMNDETHVSESRSSTPMPPIAFRNQPLKDKARVGALVLHGFTSHVSCVADLRFSLDEIGMPYRMPILRGHGTQWQDLKGVKAADWYDDASSAMDDLLTECRKVVVVGLSMGGLVTLDLAMKRPKDVAAIVTVAAALRFQDKLAFLSPLMSALVQSWPSPKAYHDENLEKQRNRNYERFATEAFVQLYRYSKKIETDLKYVNVPCLIIHSKKDQVIDPKAASIIYDSVSSANKRLVWFEESGHEMLLDLEAPAVINTISEYLRVLKEGGQGAGE